MGVAHHARLSNNGSKVAEYDQRTGRQIVIRKDRGITLVILVRRRQGYSGTGARLEPSLDYEDRAVV